MRKGMTEEEVGEFLEEHNLDLDEDQIVGLMEDGLFEGMIHIGGKDYKDASSNAIEALDKIYKDTYHEITSVSSNLKAEKINIMNWPGEGFDPFSKAEELADEDCMHFSCKKCGEEIKVADGWDIVYCPKCQTEIYRDRVIGGDKGRFIMIELKESDNDGNKV
jgi:NADH pyrophosphatase NudC (nudix superfamily)